VDIPSTAVQLLAALLLVLPGVVYQVARSRLRGPNPDDASATNRVLRALGFSAGLNAAYLLLLGPELLGLARDPAGQLGWEGLSANARSVGWLALLLLIIIPIFAAGLGTLMTVFGPRLRTFSWLTWVPRISYNPTPRAWDYAFRNAPACYVRLLMTDSSWLGGWYGSKSFVSSYPEPREIFIEKAWSMTTDGAFESEQPQTIGMFVRCDDVRSIEFVASEE
jgi:hypothetical protein